MKTETADTITAIATPPGRSALGIVRISGQHCRSLLPEVFQPRSAREIVPFRPTLGRIVIGNDQFVDEALLTFFEAPHSYTREDLAEISCHGNPLILEKVLMRVVSAGARLAMPGEFTYRAFLNGRLDLVQAEAVQDLISAESVHQVEVALQQLEGRLSTQLKELRARMLELVALMEGNIDFSEEQHYHFIDRKQSLERLDAISSAVQRLLGTFDRGRMIRDGFNVVLVGRPNVGKSSVFNALLGFDRAIVTATPGTTRDYLRERIRLGNYVVNLLDTAGIRDSMEEIEQEGIRRSREVVEKSDLVVFIIDGSEELKEDDLRLWADVKGRDVLLVCNKCDRPRYLEQGLDNRIGLRVSAVTCEGLDDLLDGIRQRIEDRIRFQPEDSLVSNFRHRDLLRGAADQLLKARDGIAAGSSEELPLVDLHGALASIGEITGEVTVDEIYQHIFSNFCIGK
ncbi:MAG TPA: tRNA uridine-5-carboxymethylaminomethyl(34) synthesis GTPase MnmE [Acidobacteriota bacterium]|nr:tRNA uridine-5-carboxymethylaminomethyl(34) synthesis GTPase MnmE [Acidobacteriota bacterium]